VLFAELCKPELAPQKKTQIDITEMAESFDTYPVDIDGSPRWRLNTFFEEIRLRHRLAAKDTPDLFPPYTLLFVEAGKLPYGGDGPLTRASGSPDRFNEGPILVVAVALCSSVTAKVHAHIIRWTRTSDKGVVSTTFCFEKATAISLKFRNRPPSYLVINRTQLRKMG
jgi:hypothetical protein